MSLSSEIVKASVPFVDRSDFSELIDMCKDKKVVMLGESTHGTKEFYEWRSIITAELIQKHGFNFIAVEGDWPPCQKVNDFIQRRTHSGSFETLANFSRWPTWMWANEEMIKFMDWLNEWNLESKDLVGFHGLDVYSLYESIDHVLAHLQEVDSELANKAKDYYSCFDPYRHDEKAYARSLFDFPEGCESKVTKAVIEILEQSQKDPLAFFSIKQNARIISNAERYYRSVVFDVGDNSWNIRDKHMMDTLEMLLDHYGDDSKAILWEHNTHIGDYRATDMALRGQVNIGGLAREKWGEENVCLVGFTTYSGSVIASHAWAGPMQVLKVPEARPGSLEYHLHDLIPQVGHNNYYLKFDELEDDSSLYEYLGHRAIGVVYQSGYEGRGNYVPSSVARRYDALVFIDKTQALAPLNLDFDQDKIPETYPYGSRI